MVAPSTDGTNLLSFRPVLGEVKDGKDREYSSHNEEASRHGELAAVGKVEYRREIDGHDTTSCRSSKRL